MDKQRNNRISITINGKEQDITVQDKQEQKDEEFPWVLPDQDGNHTKMIESKKMKNSHQKSERLHFDGQHEFPSFEKKKSPFKGSKRTLRFRISPIWVSFLSAVGIGTILGMIVLMLFSDINILNSATNQSSIMGMANITEKIGGEEQGDGKTLSQEADGASEPVAAPAELQALTVYVAQAGAFSNNDSALTALANMKELGYPGEIFDNEQVLLFIGIGQEKEAVKKLSTLYTKREEEIYVKPYTVQGGQYSNSNIGNYIAKGLELYKLLLQGSTIAATDQPIDSQQLSQIETVMEEWKALKPTEALNQDITTFSADITRAYELVRSPQASTNDSLQWDIQQNLLSALLSYEKIQN